MRLVLRPWRRRVNLTPPRRRPSRRNCSNWRGKWCGETVAGFDVYAPVPGRSAAVKLRRSNAGLVDKVESVRAADALSGPMCGSAGGVATLGVPDASSTA